MLVIFEAKDRTGCPQVVFTSRADRQCYDILEILRKNAIRVRRVNSVRGYLGVLHYDNAPCNTALLVHEFLVKYNLATVFQPPYSLDLG